MSTESNQADGSAPAPTPAQVAGPDAPVWHWCGLVLLAFVSLGTWVSWRVYPVFVDVYYHMAAVEGFQAAGGLVTHAFWEMAPAGRVHIYPPALHVLGLFLTHAGLSATSYVTWLSALAYPACMLTTWFWLRRMLGARIALFAVIGLCGPPAFFWNQAVHTANAWVLVVAPLALLAHERGRWITSAGLNLVAISLHPIGLFLPPALGVNTVLRRQPLGAGWLAASLPVLLYSPWLAHIWAHRGFLTDNRTSLNLELTGPGATLSVWMLIAAVPALAAFWRRGGPAWALLGPLVGFAVVLPMGFGGRFFTFNVHWPLACLAGLGVDYVLRRLEQRCREGTGVAVVAVGVGLVGLLMYPSLDGRSGGRGRGPGPAPGRPETPFAGGPGMGPEARVRGPQAEFPEGRGVRENPIDRRMGWRLGMQSACLPRLFDPTFRPTVGPGPGPGGGLDLIHQPGAREFLAAVRHLVPAEAVIHVAEPPAASLVSGVAGRRTTGGILRDVLPFQPSPPPEACDYLAVLSGTQAGPFPPGGAIGRPGRLGPRFAVRIPDGFESVFENEFGTLWQNPEPERAPRDAPPPMPVPVLSTPRLAWGTGIGLVLILAETLGLRGRRRAWSALAGTWLLGWCLLPLGFHATEALRDPPQPPPRLPDLPPWRQRP